MTSVSIPEAVIATYVVVVPLSVTSRSVPPASKTALKVSLPSVPPTRIELFPAASVSGWYLAHPDSHYFGLGAIERDQVADYAERKGLQVKEVERWLSTNLAYDPLAKP
ncbi:MAG: hypothetical protein IH877_04430 [Gemmatimonadetes bacterium]|nr:hypothetical protein [Gemmatimonadota bacterium]